MTLARKIALATAAATAAAVALAVAGCGVGPGESQEGEADLTVTRDYGAERLLEAESVDPSASETVVRFLDREAEIETSYGGNFVDSIDGVAGEISSGRSRDWFFYVNGYWSPIGAGESKLSPGDRIWWDYRDWTDAYRVSAVVGSWPEPFLHGYGDGDGVPAVEVVCLGGDAACDQVSSSLAAAGADATEVDGLERASDPARTLRLLVGPWDQVRADRAARQLERGPDVSGVFARVQPCPSASEGAYALSLLDERAEAQRTLDEAGWVAAVQQGDDQPTWIISATAAGEPLQRAAETLSSESLADRYALAVDADGVRSLPVASDGAAPTPTAAACGGEAEGA